MKNIRMEGKCPLCGRFRIPRCEHGVPARYFFIDFNFKGVRISRGTNLDGETLRILDDAVALRQKAMDEMRQGKFNPAKWTSKMKIDYSFNFLIDKWYREKERELMQMDLKPGYVSKLWQYMRLYYVEYFGNRDIRGIFNVKEFALQLPDKLSPKYRKNIIDALRAFFFWLKNNRYIQEMPISPEIKVPEHMPKTITFDTQMKICEFIPSEHKSIFQFMFYQGCRPSEVRALKWDCIEDDIVFYRRTFSQEQLVESTKTRKVTANRLFPETLSSLPSRTFPLDFVFRHGKEIIRHYSKTFLSDIFRRALAAFKKHYNSDLEITLYEATKHSFYTQMRQRGVSLDNLRRWGGHTSVRTTEKYAKLDVIEAFRKVERI